MSLELDCSSEVLQARLQPGHHLDFGLVGEPSQIHTEFLTCRNCEIINGCGFKPRIRCQFVTGFVSISKLIEYWRICFKELTKERNRGKEASLKTEGRGESNIEVKKILKMQKIMAHHTSSRDGYYHYTKSYGAMWINMYCLEEQLFVHGVACLTNKMVNLHEKVKILIQ